jgi:hypothetical protein
VGPGDLVEKPFNHFVTGHVWHRQPPAGRTLSFSVPLRGHGLQVALILARGLIDHTPDETL